MKKLLARIRRILRNKRIRRDLYRVISVLAAITVFITTYALVLPAITMEKTASCGIEEHQHDKSCFAQELICGLEESEDHKHTDDCYKQILTCGKEPHTHSAACYEADGEASSGPSDPSDSNVEMVSDPHAETTSAPSIETASDPNEETASDPNAETASDPSVETASAPSVETASDPNEETASDPNAETTSEPVIAQPPNLEPVNLAEYLTDDTSAWYRSVGADGAAGADGSARVGDVGDAADADGAADAGEYDWERITDRTELEADDIVRFFFAYSIPAGMLNETNPETRFTLPRSIHLTDAQIEELNTFNDGRGAWAVEGLRTPDTEPVTEEYVSAWFKLENVQEKNSREEKSQEQNSREKNDQKKNSREGKASQPVQEVVLTFDAPTIEKNLNLYDAEGNVTRQGQTITGHFLIDVNTWQIDFDEGSEENHETYTETVETDEGPVDRTIEETHSRAEVVLLPAQPGAKAGTPAGDGISTVIRMRSERILSEELHEEFPEEEDAQSVQEGDVEGPDTAEEGTAVGGSVEAADTVEDVHGVDGDAEESALEEGSVEESRSVDGDGEKDDRAAAVRTLTFEGPDYTITASYTEEAGIPENASLVVSEIKEGTEAYESYRAQAEEAVAATDVSWIRLFDISIEADGKPIEPDAPVAVQIQYHEAIVSEQDTEVSTVHFEGTKETPRLLDTETAGTENTTEQVSFETDGFSVFAIVGTVIEKNVLASDGKNYKITVTYGVDAKLPDDVDLSVSEISPGTEAYNHYLEDAASRLGKEAIYISYARIFDICLVSKDDPDKHYQPAADVAVNIELVDAGENEMENLKVLHISDAQVDVLDSVTEGNALNFVTSSFSIYPIVGDDGENARIGYRFWYNDGTQDVLLSTQYFRYKDVHPETSDGLTINEPSIPGIESATWNRIFRGWSLTSFNDSDGNLKTVETLNNELSAKAETDFAEGTYVDVYANLKDVYYVTYVDVNPNNILATEIVPLSETGDTTFTVKPESQLRPTIDSDTVLQGWYDINNPGTTYSPGQENVTISSNVTLYPKIEGGSWLIFDDNDPVWNEEKQEYVSGGASFTPPAFYLDEVTQKPADPTWAGYEFGGWYIDPQYTTPFEFGNVLEHDTTVYAKWIPSASQYRVIYWKQRATDAWDADDEDKTYDYADSRLVTDGVVTGQIVNLATSDTRVYGAGGSSGESDQDYFTYNAGKTDQSIVVKADGSSVINVYYDRQVITINFEGNLYHYEETSDTSGELYAYIDGEYIRVYPDGNSGYETRTTTTRTETVTHQYNGTRYNTTTGNTGDQWGIYNNQVVRVYRHYQPGRGGYDHWSRMQNHQRSSDDQQYDGFRYIVNNSGSYGFVNGTMIQLDSSGNYTTTETITETISTPFTGTVYKRVTQNGLTLKGLYERSMYPGEWPTRTDGDQWAFKNDSDQNVSLNAPWTSYTISAVARTTEINNRQWELYRGNTASSYQKIYYYGENVDGEYSILLADTGRASNSTLNVNNNKFYGYKMYGWRFGTTGTWHDLTNVTNETIPRPDGTGGGGTTPLYIYYSRDKFNLTFYTNNGGNQVDVIYNVPFEKTLSEYATHSEGQRNGYYFLGWYADPSCTEPFDFTQTMPHNNVAVYGKWRMERFRIVIEPGANNVYMGSQTTRFRIDFDEAIDGGLMESATRAGYILDGWYTDPDFTNRFLFTNPVNSTTPGVDMTYQTSPTWAAARAAYGDDDEEHENVRGILHLYAKWIPDPTSTGINVVYDAGDAALYDSLGDLLTTVPIDTHMYGFDGTATGREAPSNYNDLYTFKYWEATKEDGTKVTIYPGDPVNLAELSFSDPIYDENGDLLRKTVTLRAVYNQTGDPSRITHITYNGDTISYTKYGTSETQVLQGKTRDGTNQITVTLNEEVNQTIVLPDEKDFYLNGYKLVGWSFFEGSYEEQILALAEYNADKPDNLLTDFECGQEVAADNLDQGPVNDRENTLYAMWKPKEYTVTVRQVVENGVPQNTFDYSYKRGEESAISSVSETVKALSGNSSFIVEELGYYDRTGDVIRIVTPVIPDNATYSVRVNAIVTKDDGTTEILNPTAAGDYQILGDVVITYTYSLNVPVKLQKRDATNHEAVLISAVFTVTPVEFNSSTQHWENAGAGETLKVNSATFEKYLQEGTYRIVEVSAPDGYAKIEPDLYLTVKKDEAFTLFSENGSEISSSIAELDASGKTLTVYDNPVRTVTLSKTVAGGSEDSFSFKVTVFNNDGGRLGNYVIGTADGYNLTTNNIGEVAVLLGNGQSVDLKIPHGYKLKVEETEDSRYEASYVWNSEDSVDSSIFGSDPVSITADGSLVYTNTPRPKKLRIHKIGNDSEDGLAGAVFSLTATGVDGFTNLTDVESLDGTTVAADLGYLPGNDDTDPTLFILPVGSTVGTYTLSETEVPDYYEGLMGAITLAVTVDGITISKNANDIVELRESDDGVYTLTVTNMRKVATVSVIKNVASELVIDKNIPFSFKQTGLDGPGSFDLVGNTEGITIEGTPCSNSKQFTNVPYGTTFSVIENENDQFISVETAVDADGHEVLKTNGVYTVNGGLTVTFTNTRKTSSIVISKEDNAGHSLPGAEFTLLSLDTSSPTLVSTLRIGETTQEDGVISMEDVSEITVSNLASGNYRLVESNAPDGYVILTKSIDFSVDASTGTVTLVKEFTETVEDKTVTSYVSADVDDYPDASASGNIITVKNTPGAALPNTGGPGTGIIYLLGTILTALAGAGLVMRKRRRV